MLHKFHARCGVGTPCGGVAALLGVILALVFSDPTVSAAVQQAEANAAPPPGCAMRAFEIARAALDRAGLMEEPGAGEAAPASKLEGLAPICGANVQIRLNGRVIGRAASISISRPDSDGAGYQQLRKAYNAAWAQAEVSLRLPNDALRDETARAMSAQMTLSVEVAGVSVPVAPRTWEDAGRLVNPGMSGWGVRVTDAGEPEAMFPSDMFGAAASPVSGLSGLVARMLGEGGAAAALDEPAKLRTERGVQVFEFRTTHVAQGAPGMPPVFLIRGARLNSTQGVDLKSLRGWANNAAEHLIRRSALVTGGTRSAGESSQRTDGKSGEESAGRDLGVGTIKPWQEQGGSLADRGTPMETLLCVIALRRFAQTPGVDESARARAKIAAREMIKSLSGDSSRVRDSWDATTCALFLVAADAAGGPGAPDEVDVPAAVADEIWLNVLLKVRLAFQAKSEPAFAKAVPEVSRGLIALATVIEAEDLARHPEAHERPAMDARSVREELADAREAVRQTLASVPEDRLIAQMPWLLEADLRLTRLEAELLLKGIGAAEPAATLPPEVAAAAPSCAVAMRQLRDRVLKNQFGLRDAQPDTLDLIGGIVFTAGNSTPLPTWHSARASVFLARMLREPSLTDQSERLDQVARQLRLGAFLRQLQVDADSAWLAISPSDVIGGVCAAPWDRSMPPDATSFSLMAWCELVTSLDAMSRMQAKP